MNNYQFHDTLVLRHPVFSFQQFTEENLAAKLQDSFFRDAIYLCSPVVFKELQKCDFDYFKLSKRLKITLFKYFNRMCYRPTPFALCAAVSTVKWADNAGTLSVNTASFKPHVKLSYAKSIEVAAKVLQTAYFPVKVKPNATLYKVGKQLRYIKCSHEDADKLSFYIAAVDATKLLNSVLNLIKAQSNTSELVRFIVTKANCTESEATEYLEGLLSEQVFVNAGAPNVTGEDYFDRLSKSIASTTLVDDESIYNDLSQVTDAHALNNYLGKHHTHLLKDHLYVNLESRIESGSIHSMHKKAIVDGLHCFTKLNEVRLPRGISQFVQQFNNKFEGQTIPLLLALDPEVGVGYIDLTSSGESLNIAEAVKWQKARVGADKLNWGKLQSLILKQWMAGGKYKPVILHPEDINTLEHSETNNLPSTLSVMFRLAGEKVLIEQVAGVTATSLVGRFTPVNAEIDALAKDVALHETCSNPGVIYAEIVHTCHQKTANIDRRNHIYPYEIVILTPSLLDEDSQIPLSDLYVSVRNNEVVLWSVKFGKRVIPRLSSAFNYQRDDLAAFRFLCDLQHVGLQTNFNFAIENLYPGLDFYPRVEFGKAILQCAQWHLDKAVFAPVFQEKDKQKRFDTFSQARYQLQLCQYIALTQQDHQLVFNLDNPIEVDCFLDTIQSLEKIVVKEVLAESISNPILFNETGEGLTSQYIATLYHNQVAYQPETLKLPIQEAQPTRKFYPGTEWLYFKLYSHYARTNEIIGNLIYKTIKQAFKAKLITQWFYTRYNDPEHHIRFRLKVRSGKYQQVIEIYNQVARACQKQGLISNTVIDTYHRELERYPDIEAFENIFSHSSDWVACYLNGTWQQLTLKDCLSFAFLTTLDLLQATGFSSDERIDYLNGVVDAFFNEFDYVPDLKYQLDLTYRKNRVILTSLTDSQCFYHRYKINKIVKKNLENLAKYFNQINASPIQTRFKYLADIIHMHLNRIFADQPREQEFTLYHMLLKYEKASRYTNRAL